jgi:putative nucleotidyltransferase with HDIG domain
MLKPHSEIQSLQKQFNDLNATLRSVVANLTRSNNPLVSTAIQDITLVSQGLQLLEQRVSERRQLEALMAVGNVINSASLKREEVLEEVMDSLIGLMRAERGFLMLRDKQSGELKPEVARPPSLDTEAFEFSHTIVQRVAESGEPVLTTNAQEDPRFEGQLSVAAYQLRSIMCAPLKNKDKLIGVIYVDNRAKVGLFQKTDLELIKAFANQAAVAIDNATLFDNLQRTNRELQKSKDELEEAYQKTLEGWVHALDLKDKETEGHTRRVTSLTERLARSMGVEGEVLEHIRRGALLHDIGKMGIPDSILMGKEQLTPEEREVMRQHPIYARDMLWPIKFLRPAIDIPYCHHEKWDGTGYPRGLKGMEIPFAARIFTIVDVWDALVSDRPYRKALPPDEVRSRIKADSGKHFDPNVVKVFLELEEVSV